MSTLTISLMLYVGLFAVVGGLFAVLMFYEWHHEIGCDHKPRRNRDLTDYRELRVVTQGHPSGYEPVAENNPDIYRTRDVVHSAIEGRPPASISRLELRRMTEREVRKLNTQQMRDANAVCDARLRENEGRN